MSFAKILEVLESPDLYVLFEAVKVVVNFDPPNREEDGYVQLELLRKALLDLQCNAGAFVVCTCVYGDNTDHDA